MWNWNASSTNLYYQFGNVKHHICRWASHYRNAKKKGVMTRSENRQKREGRGKQSECGDGGETGFPHPSIPPLQPEEACTSVTPQERTIYDEMSTKQKRTEWVHLILFTEQTPMHSVKCESSLKIRSTAEGRACKAQLMQSMPVLL